MNPHYDCVFNRCSTDGQTKLLLHVDDLKIMVPSESYVETFIQEVEEVHPRILKQRGRVIKYLGMMLDYKIVGCVLITMKLYI